MLLVLQTDENNEHCNVHFDKIPNKNKIQNNIKKYNINIHNVTEEILKNLGFTDFELHFSLLKT